MDTVFEYRNYKPGDETGIIVLLKKCFPKWSKMPVKYWMWKYLESPLGVYVYVALDGAKIVGVICDIPLRLKLGDQIVHSIYSDDTATDPDYRGRGIYAKLYNLSRSSKSNLGTYFNYWKTENPIISKSGSKQGDTLFPFKLCQMIKIKNTEKYLKNSGRDTPLNKLGLTLLKSSNTLTNLTTTNSKKDQDYTVTDIPEFNEKIDIFWNKIKNDYNFILEKKRDYLNWRYHTQKPKEYHTIQATKGEEVLGYCVLRYRSDEETSEGSIMDLLALTNRIDIAENLIDEALTRFEAYGANSVYITTIRGHPYQKLLARRGFIDVSRASNNTLYYNPLNISGFDSKTFTEYNPKTIYFNLY